MKFRRGQRQLVAQGAGVRGLGVKDPNAPEEEEPFKPLEWPLVRRILAWMAPYKRSYALALSLNVLTTVLDMLGPMFVRQLIDHDVRGDPHVLVTMAYRLLSAVAPGLAPRFAGWAEPGHPFLAIAMTICVWGVTVLITIVVMRFNFEFNRRIAEQVIFSIRKALFAHLQWLSMSFYDRTKFGRILSRATSDIDALANPIINGINIVFVNGLMMATAAAMLFIADWRIALGTLWLGPIVYFMNNFYRGKIGAQYRIAREHFTRVSTNLAENINGMRVVTAFNRQEENLSSFNILQDRNTYNNVRAGMINGIYQPLLQLIGFVGRVIILASGAYLVLSSGGAKGFTIGTLVALTMYWDWFMNPVLNFGNFQNEMMLSMASAERVFALLDLKPEVNDLPDAPPLPAIAGRVQFENVHFSYVKDKPVLADISFEALPGQTIALVGHTGCGKSTIMNLLCRFYLPQLGRVLIDGHDLSRITGESLHRQMGIVSQANFLFSGSVLDNIRYARSEAAEADVIAAAKILGSHDILSGLKDGYHTQVGERGASMSLGQRQLICFTRAFLADPRILMLDEATSAVDTRTEMIIQQALEKLIAHRTTFIVAHRLSTVTSADLVLVLDHGRIIERGTHRSLLELGGKYAELYKQFTREIGE
jgi:ATP-binding cassette subfamily B protein